MKVLPFILLIVLILFTISSAQSGRRVKSAPVQTATPQVQVTQNTSETEESVGYSESSPNASRSISARARNEKKSKKNTKKETKSSVQTTGASKTDSANPEDDIVKVETNLVTMPVSVFDRNGLYIPNLQQSDFKIFEDGVEQEIAYFGTSEKPFTVILLIDVSPSTEYKIEE
ncbi:MAG TPA: hypothetical protein VEX64_04930, partial [Pyrinomonadaceae bacterium]|nr:hypothetical protein [Pyrinomonadaceae bacterium]